MESSKRRVGVEWRALVWLVRHPLPWLTPTVLAVVAVMAPLPVAGVLGGLLVVGFGWYRGHPASFDRLAAPVLRSRWRRWCTRYTGRRWNDVAAACDLAVTHRVTGAVVVPRILRLRSPSPFVDLLRVRLPIGHSIRTWEQKLPELADGLGVERVAVERIRPGVLGVIVQRTEPFTEPVMPPPIPWEIDPHAVRRVWFGVDEFGVDWHENLLGQHVLGVGAMGAGKSSLMHGPVRMLAPLIRGGLVRCWDVDPKRMELARTRTITHRYATEPDDYLEVIEEFVQDMADVQRRLASAGRRVFTVSPPTPLNILRLDELAMLTAYGPHAVKIRKLLAVVGTQGRATGHAVWGFVQEPHKDVVPMRDLFTLRVCLRVTSASHVDMTLGDGARLRGALADEIPNTPDTAGIGYVVRPRTRLPVRVRAGLVTDHDLDELVRMIGAPDQLSGPDSGPEALPAA